MADTRVSTIYEYVQANQARVYSAYSTHMPLFCYGFAFHIDRVLVSVGIQVHVNFLYNEYVLTARVQYHMYSGLSVTNTLVKAIS